MRREKETDQLYLEGCTPNKDSLLANQTRQWGLGGRLPRIMEKEKTRLDIEGVFEDILNEYPRESFLLISGASLMTTGDSKQWLFLGGLFLALGVSTFIMYKSSEAQNRDYQKHIRDQIEKGQKMTEKSPRLRKDYGDLLDYQAGQRASYFIGVARGKRK